jgi:hypothetical protein
MILFLVTRKGFISKLIFKNKILIPAKL